MAEIKLRSVHLPSRCEICHRSDQFNAVHNYCWRCSEINRKREIESLSGSNLQLMFRTYLIAPIISAAAGLVFGGFAGFIDWMGENNSSLPYFQYYNSGPCTNLSRMSSIISFWGCIGAVIMIVLGVFFRLDTSPKTKTDNVNRTILRTLQSAFFGAFLGIISAISVLYRNCAIESIGRILDSTRVQYGMYVGFIVGLLMGLCNLLFFKRRTQI
jgi:hypothetical protein